MPDYTLRRPIINGRPSAVWYVCWTEARRSYRVSAKTDDKVVARAFLQQFEAQQATPPETFTIADLADAYLKEREENPKVKYPKAIANSLRPIKREMGALPPSMLSRLTVRSYTKRRRADGVMDATIDKELRFLRQALKFGVREGWMQQEPKVETPGGSAPRERFLTREEFAPIYFFASPLHLRTFLALAIDTLARGKHILALTWDRVDLERGIIWYKRHAPGSKKRTVAVPVTDRLHTILSKAKEAALSDYVIEWNGRQVASIRKAYNRAVRLAGVEDAHRHDLRRSGASWAVQGGKSFDEVAALLGDSVEVTKSTYAMFSPSYLRGVVDSIANGPGGQRA